MNDPWNQFRLDLWPSLTGGPFGMNAGPPAKQPWNYPWLQSPLAMWDSSAPSIPSAAPPGGLLGSLTAESNGGLLGHLSHGASGGLPGSLASPADDLSTHPWTAIKGPMAWAPPMLPQPSAPASAFASTPPPGSWNNPDLSHMLFGSNVGFPASAATPALDPTPAHDTRAPLSNPAPRRYGMPLHDTTFSDREPNVADARAPWMEHLDAADYRGAASARSGARTPPPGHGSFLSPMPQSPNWGSVPTRARATPAQFYREPPSQSSWGAPAPRFAAQRNSVEGPAPNETAPIEFSVAQKQLVPPGSDPHQDFAQADPFGGFARPSPVESLTNQSESYECIASRTATSAEMKGGNYEFCTYGRLAPTKQDPNTGEPTELLITAGPNGNEVYGRDRITGAWGRWTLAPGQSLIATIDEDGNFQMNIR